MGGNRMVTVTCQDCGTDVVRRATRAVGTIRCRSCANKKAAEKHRRRVVVTCKECGKDFEVKASERLRGAKFCSMACSHAKPRIPAETYARMAERMRVERRGAGNPAWKGQDTEGSVYRVFSISHKDEGRCRNCGRADGLLHLHHIVPRSMCKAAIRDLRNGVPLCPACHLGWHRRRVTIHRDIFTAEEWAYVSTLSLLGQNVEAWLDDRYPPRPMERAA